MEPAIATMFVTLKFLSALWKRDNYAKAFHAGRCAAESALAIRLLSMNIIPKPGLPAYPFCLPGHPARLKLRFDLGLSGQKRGPNHERTGTTR